jgi:hypothetical protein
MEFEQIIKRLDWLDEEHRKDKSAVEALLEQVKNLEGDLKAANKIIKELTPRVTDLSSTTARIDQFDAALAQQRTDVIKYVDKMEEKGKEQLVEVEKRYQIQFDNLSKSITELRKFKDPIAEIRREMKTSAAEEARRDKAIADWDVRIQAAIKTADEAQRAQKVSEEAHRLDSKRLADLQGEISATRKRVDESRGKIDLIPDSIRRIEARLNEVLLSETERRQAQTAFIETQARLQVDRDRAWKQWDGSLESMRKQSEAMEHHLQEWDITQRTVKRAQESYEDIVQKFERRINEITEMQRLAEDRFRQEWVTFKADDQKRWTSFTLTQDETHKDARLGIEKLEERLTVLEDLAQTQQDVIQQTKDANEQLYQGMLAQIHEFLSAYERILSTK